MQTFESLKDIAVLSKSLFFDFSVKTMEPQVKLKELIWIYLHSSSALLWCIFCFTKGSVSFVPVIGTPVFTAALMTSCTDTPGPSCIIKPYGDWYCALLHGQTQMWRQQPLRLKKWSQIKHASCCSTNQLLILSPKMSVQKSLHMLQCQASQHK